MEHRLHRKKVLTSVEQLREKERISMKRLYGASNPDELPQGAPGAAATGSSPLRTGAAVAVGMSPGRPTAATAAADAVARSPVASPARGGGGGSDSSDAAVGDAAAARMVVSFSEFCSLVRHGKLKQIKEAISHLPERRFDPLTVRTQYAPGVGTVYDDVLEKSAFHINKGDDNGNSPLMLAAQNNNLKVAQFLLSKGANPNHQNVRHLGSLTREKLRSGLTTDLVNNPTEKRTDRGSLRDGVQLLRPWRVAVGS
ncbi:hypothetical protein PINS_up009390 [Pythium insidiosum]|nr:hypothetical protein PINS_up009390 [Pythium insidiosum]